MIVTRTHFPETLPRLSEARVLTVDTETTGLRPFHGDRLFSLIIGVKDAQFRETYYFNFRAYPGLDRDRILLPSHLALLKPILENPEIEIRAHRLKFDAHMLYADGIELRGTLHCTQALARVEYNDHLKYGLAECGARIGIKKDDAVDEYITENHLWEWEQIPGKKKREKNKFYDRVPFGLIVPYAEQDVTVCDCVADHQSQEIAKLDAELKPGMPRLHTVAENEKRLVHTVIRMERTGVRIDRAYCLRAAQREMGEVEAATREYLGLTGQDFVDSSKAFEGVFASEKPLWGLTEKGNPSFDADCLARLTHPAAAQVLKYRDSKSKSDFYHGFLWHADRNDVIHTSLNQDGADTGRFSSSNPNLNNMTSEDAYACDKCAWSYEDWSDGVCEQEGCFGRLVVKEWLVRKAFIPFPGEVFFMPDYSQIEYKLMLDLACKYLGEITLLARKVMDGMDFHTAGVEIVKEKTGLRIRRGQAKTCNFLDLYGGGEKLLAQVLKVPIKQAREIKNALRGAAPEIARLTNDLQAVALSRGYVLNWLGRRYDFKRNPNICYTAPNKYVQGGSADILKLALNAIDNEFLRQPGYRLQLPIHDEIWIGMPEGKARKASERVIELMEGVYPHYCIPLKASPEWSSTNAADKRKGFPA